MPLALIWRDALATTLAAVLVVTSVHARKHAIDLHLGVEPATRGCSARYRCGCPPGLWVRLRQLGYVGRVRPAATPAVLPLVA